MRKMFSILSPGALRFSRTTLGFRPCLRTEPNCAIIINTASRKDPEVALFVLVLYWKVGAMP